MRNVVCIGGSTGSLDAIQRLVRRLPADLPAAVFIVRHIAPESSGLLAEILQPQCALPVADAVDGELIHNGRVYIGPANQHLLLEQKVLRLATGPKENWTRPAIDPLFRTAAQFHGPRSIGIILSGKLDDGTAGLWALKRRGGFAVVQDPQDAAAPDMPMHAIASVDVDVVADAEEIGLLLPKWCRQKSSDFRVAKLAEKTLRAENEHFHYQKKSGKVSLDEVGDSSGIVCPECGGQLWRMKEGPLRYRCHVGHGLSAYSLLARQKEVVEAAGWQLVRSIEEESDLAEQILLHGSPAGDIGKAVASRVVRNREKLRQLRPLLFNDLASADPPLIEEHTPENPD